MYTYLIGWVSRPYEDEYTHADILELNQLILNPADLEIARAELVARHHIPEDEITIFSFSFFGLPTNFAIGGKLAQPLPESRIAERTSVDALFNGEGAFCFPIDERERVPSGCFIVRVSIPELRALQARQAVPEKINGRWQIRLTAGTSQSR